MGNKFGKSVDQQAMHLKNIRASLLRGYNSGHIALDISYKTDEMGAFTLTVRDQEYHGRFNIELAPEALFKFDVDDTDLHFEAEYDRIQDLINELAKRY